MPRFSLLVLPFLFLSLAVARAEAAQQPQSPAPAPSLEPAATQAPASYPDLISLGAAYEGFDKFDSPFVPGSESRTRATDFKLEYRWGAAIGSAQASWLDFAIHPIAGGEASTREQFYGFGGLAFDFLMWKHLIFTQSEAAGLFDSGKAKPLGSIIEFRSQAELGWRFDNGLRLTASIAHLSNAGITHRNPGEEMAGGYIHIPVHTLFGQ